MRRIVMTGATGFVGRQVAQRLVAAGDEVVALVRDARAPLLDGVRRVPIEPLGSGALDPAPLEGTDAVLHLAALVHQPGNTIPEADYVRVNTQGTRQLAEAAAGRVRRFVYVSSVHAVARFSDEPLTPQSPCRPDTPYGRSKLAAEEEVRRVAENRGMEWVIVRPPPVYGPGMVGGLRALLRLVLRLPLLPCVRGGRRSLVYVEKLADLLVTSIDAPGAGRALLPSDGSATALPDLLRDFARAAGRPFHLLTLPSWLVARGARWTGKSATYERLAGSLTVEDPDLADVVQWRPPVPTHEAYARTANWLREAA